MVLAPSRKVGLFLFPLLLFMFVFAARVHEEKGRGERARQVGSFACMRARVRARERHINTANERPIEGPSNV